MCCPKYCVMLSYYYYLPYYVDTAWSLDDFFKCFYRSFLKVVFLRLVQNWYNFLQKLRSKLMIGVLFLRENIFRVSDKTIKKIIHYYKINTFFTIHSKSKIIGIVRTFITLVSWTFFSNYIICKKFFCI